MERPLNRLIQQKPREIAQEKQAVINVRSWSRMIIH